MKYFDFHTHAFTDSLAERAVGSLVETSGIKPVTDGTLDGLKRIMAQRNIGRAMILPIATKPKQQTNINNWAAKIMGDGIYCCGSVHPDAEDAVEEISRIKSLGLCGVKFHSEYQMFCPDEERMFPIYEKISETGLIAVFHGGWDPYCKGEIKATPKSFAAVAERFLEMKIVAAHLGGVTLLDDVEEYIAGKFDNLWLDTGIVSKYIDDSRFLRIIKSHGIERILFGSDCPWDDPADEIELINRLPLSDDEKERIFYKNAEMLINSVLEQEGTTS